MNIFEELYNKISSFDVEKAVSDSIEETKEDIADLNAEQMFLGLRSTGKKIDANGYSPFTIKEKKKKGQVTDRVTLRDTGSFYEGIIAKVTRDKVSVFSTDEKNDLLEKRYSKTIFGLTNDSKRTYSNGNFYNTLTKKIKEGTGL